MHQPQKFWLGSRGRSGIVEERTEDLLHAGAVSGVDISELRYYVSEINQEIFPSAASGFKGLTLLERVAVD